MNPLAIIGDPQAFEGKVYRTRHAARAVLFDNEGKIPLLYVGKYDYHKLPGGGIDEGETIEEALHRECMEEVGATIEIGEYLGEVIEYRAYVKGEREDHLLQISHCFIAKITQKGESNLTEYERANDFSCIWVSLSEAIKLLESDKPKIEEGEYIRKRDLTFLKHSKAYEAVPL